MTLELIRKCGIIWFSIGLCNCSDSVALLVFHFSIGLWNCSDSVALLVFHFSIGLWNCSDSVALLVCIWEFETVLTVWHYLFWYGTLELFRQCGIICFFYWTLELLRKFDIICFSTGLWIFSESVALLVFHFAIGLWDYSHSVALLMYLLDFGTVPTVWHHLLFNWTLELFRECGIIGFSFVYWTLELFR